ncbi:MAG: DUF1800 family protein [Bacteroidia bacterium]|nr:DUF1800 family protein [Bacteroidia bacterium]
MANYSGTWGETQVRHLLRRTLFGHTKADVDFFKAMSMSDAVDYLLNIPTTQPSPPVNGYNTPTNIDPDISVGDTWINGPENNDFSAQRRNSLYAWSMEQILSPDRHIREKMTFFFHNHFATETETIGSPIIAYNHHKMLRENCLGNFKDMVKLVTLDVGMLIYLNGYLNTKTAPDENYARELLELFTLGKSPESQYTEDDVKAAARVLTGWRINITNYTSFFSSVVHDTNNKTFSAFFNNTTINGQSGNNGALETDDLINMIFSKEDVVARYIVRKLYRYFVYYVIDTNIENNVIIPLANDFKQNWEIKPLLEALLKSEHFYDSNNIGCYIKNPLDVYSTFIKQFKVQFPTSNVEDKFSAYYTIWIASYISGLFWGNPPNVSGWPAYYQTPQYYQLWLNSDTLPKRIMYTVYLMVGFQYKGTNTLVADIIGFAQECSDPSDPNKLIQESINQMFSMDISATQKQGLKESTLLFGQTSDYYWTNAWNDYMNDPNDTGKKNIVLTGLIYMYKYLLDLAENQLA